MGVDPLLPMKLQASQTTPLGYACIGRQTTRVREIHVRGYKSDASAIEEQYTAVDLLPRIV